MSSAKFTAAISLCTVLFAVPVPATADAPAGDYSPEQALKYSQGVLGNHVSDYLFTDQHQRQVQLSSFSGKPLVVSFIYTSCYHFCPTITRNLKHVMDIAEETLGGDRFNIVTIGFDTAVDTPGRMRQFARELKISNENWWFLSVDENNIGPLTREFGFLYYASPRGFDHLAQITILDQEGRVYRQIYGTDYTPQHMIEPLKELIFGQAKRLPTGISDWIDNIRLFCTVYDPSTGRYHFDYSIFMALLIGLLCLGSILVFVIHAWRARQVRSDTGRAG